MYALRRWTVITIVIALGAVSCSGPDGVSSSGEFANRDPAVTEVVDPTATFAASATSVPPVSTPSSTTADPPTATPAPSATGTPAPTQTPVPSATATMPPSPTPVPETVVEGVLPNFRILSFYGHPSTGNMGILGEYEKSELLDLMRSQAAEYEAADPTKAVKLAFEIIATVAQPNPGDDGTYLLYTGDDWIGEYVDFATSNDMLVILDLQIGHNTIANEIERVRHWLELPNVHVALDPEFSTGPDRIPGEFIGEVDGNGVNTAIEMLAEIVAAHDLPSKILIVHQFEPEMIYNKGVITPQPGVDVVIDMDGFGGPDAKLKNYDIFVRQELIEYGGIKLFYRQDDPLIDPWTIVSLDPPPLVVIYQ
jgi:hypothetical protein